MKKSFRPMVELLEDRRMLSATLPSSLPSLQAMSQPVKVIPQGVLPGSINIPLGRYDFSVLGHGSVRFNGVSLTPYGDGPLSQNLREIDLWADLDHIANNGPRKDGFETLLGSRVANWQTDVANILVSRTVYVNGGQPLKVLVLGQSNTFLSGTELGAYLAQANLSNWDGALIPDSQISYTGADPVLQPLKSDELQVYQTPMANTFGTVLPSQTSVPVLQFNAYANASVNASFAFTATGSGLSVGQSFQLLHMDYSGKQDAVAIQGKVVGGTLTFKAPIDPSQGGSWQVAEDIKSADKLPAHPAFQFQFLTISAIDLSTNKPMSGLVVNDWNGVGQMRLNANLAFATQYTVSMTSPTVAVSLNAESPPNQGILGGQFVVAAKYDVTSAGDSYVIKSFGASVFLGVQVTSISLWDGNTLLATQTTENNPVFTGLNILVAANTNKTLTVKVLYGTPIPGLNGLNGKVTLTSLGVMDSHGIASTLTFNVYGNNIFVYDDLRG